MHLSLPAVQVYSIKKVDYYLVPITKYYRMRIIIYSVTCIINILNQLYKRSFSDYTNSLKEVVYSNK